MNRLCFSLAVTATAHLWMACCAWSQPDREVRSPAVAGQFYSSDAGHLRQAIRSYLQDAVVAHLDKPVALVVPHAGYVFAGQVMADGYRQVQDLQPEVVVVLGVNHTTAGFEGISIYDRGAFRTPLGDAEIDDGLSAALLASCRECSTDRRVHRSEHSIEVQVPFIQVLFPRAKIVPIIVGAPDPALCARFGETLANALKGRRSLIVASSDLSHYPSWPDAGRIDRETLTAIAAMDPVGLGGRLQAAANSGVRNLDTCACGEAPIRAVMAAARALGAARGVVVSYANSGDVLVGDRARVVGYGAVAFCASGEPPRDGGAGPAPAPEAGGALGSADKKALLGFARRTLERFLATESVPTVRGLSPRLQTPQAAFVTLKKRGELRGCIGHMAADMPLAQTVGAMALEAAFNDTRFKPVGQAEVRELEIEISVLTPMKPVARASDIKVGRDGVVLQIGERSAVFLPQVAVEQGWDYPEMLDNLCMKAGLPEGCWKQGARLLAFQADVFSEHEFK